MRIAICDDMESDQVILKNYIEAWSSNKDIEVEIKRYHSSEHLKTDLLTIQFDLILLDIEIGKENGIELAKYIRKRDRELSIIFVSSFSQYAIDSYEVAAIYYLTKNNLREKLPLALDRAYLLLQSNKEEFLIVSSEDGQQKLPIGQILYIEMFLHTAEIRTETKTFTLRKPMREIKKLLPEHFVYCHRSIVINLLKVENMRKEATIFSNGDVKRISRQFSRSVNEAFIKLYAR